MVQEMLAKWTECLKLEAPRTKVGSGRTHSLMNKTRRNGPGTRVWCEGPHKCKLNVTICVAGSTAHSGRHSLQPAVKSKLLSSWLSIAAVIRSHLLVLFARRHC